MSTVSPLSLPVTIIFHSDWGVSTGTGIAGGVDSIVEKDEHGLPVVRATVVTGAVREQAFLAAQALDGGTSGGWRHFVEALFGTAKRPRLVSFSDARLPADAPPESTVHDVVSLSIDEATGTAKKDHLRFFERASACTLTGTVELHGTDLYGNTIAWSDPQRRATELVLALSGLLVRALGSNRSDGDGLCDVLVGDADGVGDRTSYAARTCEQLEQWTGQAPEPPAIQGGTAERSASAPVISATPRRQSGTRPDDEPSVFRCAELDIVLRTPVISYEVPFSNEIRSLDFLRGTMLLPLIHRRLRGVFQNDAVVRDAVVNGSLLVSDATVVVDGVRGLAVPLVLSTPKVERAKEGGEGGSRTRVLNRLLTGEPEEVHKPLRSGYVFPRHDLALAGQPTADGLAGAIGAPALVGRQSTAHDSRTGAAGAGQLFLVKALPTGLCLRATVLMSEALHEHVRSRLDEIFPPGGFPERLGSRRLSGAYGRASCTLGQFRGSEADPPKWDRDGATTLWLTSDVLVRSPRLGPGGRRDDLIAALIQAGASVGLVDGADGRFAAGIRHRRIDSWAAADGQPRATRTAISAGSVLRVRPAEGAAPDAVIAALARLSIAGVGELRAQGFGRFVVGHPLLERNEFSLARLEQGNMLGTRSTTVPTSEEGR